MKVEFSRKTSLWIAAALLAVMAVVMFVAARNDSAAVDETTAVGAGYSYLTGYRYKMQCEHPPLSQILPTFPLLFMNVRYSDQARALLDGRVGYPWAVPWAGQLRPVQELFPQGRNDWYFTALPESQLFGQIFVYDGTNDGDSIMFICRLVQIILTLLAGVLVYFWVNRTTSNPTAAVAALALWVFNPVALSYGHLVTTDVGVVPAMVLAILLCALFLDKPSPKIAALCGVATAVALVMKYTAIILGPIFVVLIVLGWKQLSSAKINYWKTAAIFLGAGWLTLFVVYFPLWSPAPLIPESQATALGVPHWFQTLRPVLLPPNFFKGLALKLAKSHEGHDDYLLGQWSQQGWWYYFPLAFFFKSPLAFVALTALGVAVFGSQFKSARLLEIAPWVAAAVFMLSAMTTKVNIGVRHLLPIFPLLCVGIGCALARLRRPVVKGVVLTLVCWQIAVTVMAYPLYIQFFSESVGGAKNGYQYLVDSNYDWGQDAKRLKQFLDQQGIKQIYLDYFGTQYSIEYLKIPNQRVTADTAKQIRQGCLVVSASELVRPEWTWLRESRQPVTRVAYTLFVYQFP